MENISKKELRNLGLILGAITTIVFGLLIPTLHHHSISLIYTIIGFILIAAGLLIPHQLKPLHFIWQHLSIILAWINTRIILGLIYFLLITPIGLLKRLFRKNSMILLKKDADLKSYRIISTYTHPKQMERPF